ncbi:MAG: M81 family metallopeptidase, partial [Anaerolineae bacterium]
MRVLVGAIGHESNTFTPFLTTIEDFHARYGPQILEGPLRRSSLAGIVDTLRAHDVELVPTVAAHAMPGGIVERGAYETFRQAVLEQAHDVDGVCL